MNDLVFFFDFDGVIKESVSIKTEAFYKMYLKHGIDIAKKVKKYHIENGGVSRFEKFKYLHKNFLKKDISNEELKTLANQFSEIVLNDVVECKYVPGAVETIKKLSKTNLLFIVTGTPQKEIDIIIDRLNIKQHFQQIVGSPRNKIELSSYLLKNNNIDSKKVVFIGDALSDYNAAKHFNFNFILREHEENILLFENKQITKTKDLSKLHTLLNNFI